MAKPTRAAAAVCRTCWWFAERQQNAPHNKGAVFALIVVVDPRNRSLIINTFPNKRPKLHLACPAFGLRSGFFLGPMQAAAAPHCVNRRAVPGWEQKRRPTNAVFFILTTLP
jgi:hypothetical protein